MNLPKRKPTRLRHYDYSTPGMYFVTVCTKGKRHLLGKIVGFGVYDEPKMILSEYGKILDKHIKLMDEKYPHIKVHKYIVMPNHFHMILYITERKVGSSASAEPYNNETSKFVSLLKRFCNREAGENIWQSHFHDHIIRGERDYQKNLAIHRLKCNLLGKRLLLQYFYRITNKTGTAMKTIPVYFYITAFYPS